MNMNIGDYQYNENDGLYYFEGMGMGYHYDEVMELMVEVYEENKRRKIAERSED